jgi:hypothetical protein
MRGAECPKGPRTVPEGLCHWACEIWGPKAQWRRSTLSPAALVHTPCILALQFPEMLHSSLAKVGSFTPGNIYRFNCGTRTMVPLHSGLFQSEPSQERVIWVSWWVCSSKGTARALSAGVWVHECRRWTKSAQIPVLPQMSMCSWD